MTLAAGTRLGLYEITAPIGAPAYEATVTGSDGTTIFHGSFEPRIVIRDFFDRFPSYEKVRVETGWLRATSGPRTLVDERIETDPERFWDHFQAKTLPAHASILTSLEPFAHGVRNNTSSRLGQTPTLATMLKSAGYRTGAFVGALVLNAAFGLDRDFDVYDDRFGRPSDDAGGLPLSERPAERVIRPAVDWILGGASSGASEGPASKESFLARPWFAWIHLYDPHAPYRALQLTIGSDARPTMPRWPIPTR
jgi:hypothetical protein